MREDFLTVKNLVPIQAAAEALRLKPDNNVPNKFYYPGEKTASIKLFPATNSFFDFGRSCGGDCIRLWSHVRGCDSWTALQEIRETFGIDNDKTPDRQEVRRRIQQQEAQEAKRKAEEAKRREQWRWRVDVYKNIIAINLRQLQDAEPMSDIWCKLANQIQLEEYRLDCLCGVEPTERGRA